MKSDLLRIVYGRFRTAVHGLWVRSVLARRSGDGDPLGLAPHDATGHALTCDRVSGPVPLPAYFRHEDRKCTSCGCVLATTLEEAIRAYMTSMAFPHNSRQEAAHIQLNVMLGRLSPSRKEER